MGIRISLGDPTPRRPRLSETTMSAYTLLLALMVVSTSATPSGYSGYSGDSSQMAACPHFCGPEPDSEPDLDLNAVCSTGDHPFMYADECIPDASLVCDGCYDCVDASDELYCDSGVSGYSGYYSGMSGYSGYYSGAP